MVIYLWITASCLLFWCFSWLCVFLTCPTGCWSNFTSRWQHQLSGFQSPHHARELPHRRILGQRCELCISLQHCTLIDRFSEPMIIAIYQACLTWRTTSALHNAFDYVWSSGLRSGAGRCRIMGRLSPKPNRCTQVQCWMHAGVM